LGTALKGIVGKAIGEGLFHPDALREDPCPSLEQGHLREVQLQIAPLEIAPLSLWSTPLTMHFT
jgi:hypothetical protein